MKGTIMQKGSKTLLVYACRSWEHVQGILGILKLKLDKVEVIKLWVSPRVQDLIR